MSEPDWWQESAPYEPAPRGGPPKRDIIIVAVMLAALFAVLGMMILAGAFTSGPVHGIPDVVSSPTTSEALADAGRRQTSPTTSPTPTRPTSSTSRAVARASTRHVIQAPPTTYRAPRITRTATPRITRRAEPTRAPASTYRPTPRPTRSPPGPATRYYVHPGAFCAPIGAVGTTRDGTVMHCTIARHEHRARWRHS